MKAILGILSLLVAANGNAVSVLVFDLTPSAGATATRVFSLPNAPASITKRLETFVQDGGTTEDEAALVKELRAALPGADLRWITTRGDTVTVYALYDMRTHKQPKIDFSETERKTRLAEDLSTLAKIVEQVGAKELRAPPPIRAIRADYNLTLVRAQLTVNANAPALSCDPANAVGGNAKLITGPAEHFFLSADVPLNSVSDVKYDSSGNAIGPAKTPSTFYAGIDFITGDILRERRSALESIVVKALLKISKSPLDSYGFAAGYRLPAIKAYGFELDTFSPFAGYIWTRSPKGTTSVTKGHVRLGLSFNLDKALGWIK